ncbi:uncharacterized protein LOC124478831 isoform X2 [Hypomesus transpacificus]|nr:uncharacterized protein LOC124478831 isoform X2 [Hypomesus transpacificus]XP_046893271.1 uncharacterized protein LOC124478831 isoform X2 [Hypomesus transpacificus]
MRDQMSPKEGGAGAILPSDQTIPAAPLRVTAQEVLSLKFPLLRERLLGMNRKWAKRTAKMTTIWPEHGTFDLSLCDDMRVLIVNHRHSGSVGEKLKKRAEETEVLKLYEEQGQNYRDTAKACLLAAKTDHETLGRASPPPYAKEKSGSAPPRKTVYTGEAENPRYSSSIIAPLEKAMGAEYVPVKGAYSHVKKMLDGKEGAASEEIELTGAYQHIKELLRESEKKGCSSHQKEREMDNRQGEPKPLVSEQLARGVIPITSLVSCAQSTEQLLHELRTQLPIGEDQTDLYLIGKKAFKAIVSEARKEARQDVAGRPRSLSEAVVSGVAVPDRANEEQAACCQTPDLASLSLQPQAETAEIMAQKPVGPIPNPVMKQGRPVRSRNPPLYYQAPILVRGTQMYYVPWTTMDMTGLITRLPNPYEGASRWIKAFEQETLGHNIAIGDIKMILGRTLGAGGLSDVMHSQHLADILETHAGDGDLFNVIRTEVWESLRILFPDRVKLEMLTGEKIGPSEPPMAFIHKTLGKWRAELGKNPEDETLQQAMFRQGVVRGLTETVQERLAEVVGLYSMPFAQFCEQLTHAVERERKYDEKRLQSDREDMRKLNKLQLKSGLQAVLMAPPGGNYRGSQWGKKPELLALESAPQNQAPKQGNERQWEAGIR